MDGWVQLGRTASPTHSTLYTVFNRINDAVRDADYANTTGPGRMVAGLPLPPFQREVVWDEDHMIRFVDSARRGIPLGTYTINDTFGQPSVRREEGGHTWYECDRWLLDGQQRLTALERFFSDGFRVGGSLWSEVGKTEQRLFLMGVKFPFVETKFLTAAEAAEYYDLMNFGGVAHTEEERSVPRP